MRRGRDHIACQVGFLLVMSAAAHGQASEKLLLDVVINGRPVGLVASFERQADGGFLIARKELSEIGLRAPSGADGARVAMRDLPGVSYEFDAPAQRIRIRAEEAARTPFTVDLRPTVNPAEAVTTNYAIATNYTLFASQTDLSRDWYKIPIASLLTETRVISPYGSLGQGLLATASRGREARAVRLDTTFTYADQVRATTYRAGDFITRGPAWSRPIRVGGAQLERDYGLRPDIITAPLPGYSGRADAPSTLDVYVNSVRASRVDVPAGGFQVSNIPAVSGGETKLVLRDSSGRSIEATAPFVSSPALLREGVTDFAFQLGAPRIGYGGKGDRYVEEFVGAGGARYGLRDSITIEAYGEGGNRLINGSVGASIALNGVGAFTFAGGGSLLERRPGALSYASFEAKHGGFTINLSSQRTFGAYTDLATLAARAAPNSTLLTLADLNAALVAGAPSASYAPPRAVERILVATQLWRGALNFGLARIVRQNETTLLGSVGYSQPLPYSASLTATLFSDLTQRRHGVFATLTAALGATDIRASSTVFANPDGVTSASAVEKPVGADVGSFGWRAGRANGASGGEFGSATYLAPVARLEAQAVRAKDGVRATAQADGAIVLMDGGLLAASRLGESFGVADVGVPNASVTHQGRVIGRSNAQGKLLIPSMTPQEPNIVAIDTDSLSPDTIASKTRISVTPPRGGAVVARFGVETSATTAVATLAHANGAPVAPGATARLNDRTEIVVGYDGQILLSGLQKENRITLAHAGCVATFSFAPGQRNLGPLTCR